MLFLLGQGCELGTRVEVVRDVGPHLLGDDAGISIGDDAGTSVGDDAGTSVGDDVGTSIGDDVGTAGGPDIGTSGVSDVGSDPVPDAGVDPCQSVDCSGHGSCVAAGSLARCECDDDYAPAGLSCVLDTVAPSVPANLVAEYVSATQTDLRWEPSMDNGRVALYRVFRREDGAVNFAVLDTSERPLYQDRSVTVGQKYAYVVSAVDGAQNESGRSNEAAVPEHGGLSGTIRDSDGPIAGLAVFVYGGPCFEREVAQTTTNGGGEYVFGMLPASDVYILAYPASSTLNYLNTWWTSAPAGTRDCRSATAVTIVPGQTNANHDFLLEKGVTVTGKVSFNGAPVASPPWVQVRTGDCQAPAWDGSPPVFDAQGQYTVRRVPAGTIYFAVIPPAASVYEEQWWNGGSGTTDCAAAQGMTVVPGQTVTDIDFALREKNTSTEASVSGRVTYQGNPVSGLKMIAYGSSCGSGFLNAEADTDANGDYTITGIAVTQVYVKACPTCRATFTQPDSWWDGTTGSGDCTAGIPIALAMGQTRSGIDFTLQAPGTISGRVVLDGVGVSGVLVHAYQKQCDVNYLRGTSTASDGQYTITRLPAGSAYVRTSAKNQPSFSFTDEWYDGGQSTASCLAATPVTISAGQDTAGVDIHVEQ